MYCKLFWVQYCCVLLTDTFGNRVILLPFVFLNFFILSYFAFLLISVSNLSLQY